MTAIVIYSIEEGTASEDSPCYPIEIIEQSLPQDWDTINELVLRTREEYGYKFIYADTLEDIKYLIGETPWHL